MAETYTEILAFGRVSLAIGTEANGTKRLTLLVEPVFGGGDVTAPVLSSPAGASTGTNTADISVETDEGEGNLFWVVTTNISAPSPTQIKLGQDHLGAAAPDAGNQQVLATGQQNASAAGLSGSTAYYAHFMQEDGSANQSSIVTSNQFTTEALPDTLSALTLPSQNPLPENAVTNHTIGAISGTTPGSTVTVSNSDGGRVDITFISGTGTWVLFYSGTGSDLDFSTEPILNIELTETLASASNSPRVSAINVNVSDVDNTAPTLSAPTATESGTTTADIGVTTNEGNGTLYWVISTSSTAPSAAQVKAGQIHTGAAATDSGSQAISSTGAKTDTASGLTAATNYWAHFMHEDAATNQSSVSSSAQFTTDAASSLAALVLTATTTTENPPEWDSAHDGDVVPWGSVDADSGDKHRLIWRLGGAGGWTTEVYQELDDELFTGGFTWPLWEAAMPYVAGGTVEVKEQRARYVDGVQVAESAESNTLTFTVDPAGAPWTPADYTGGTYAYYDVSDITSLWQDTGRTVQVTASGDTVSVIDDLSGGGRHLIGPAGQAPIYRTDGGAGGDKPYLDFDGSNDYMQSAAYTAVSQPHYQAVAVKMDVFSANTSFIDGESNTNRHAITALSSGPVFAMTAGTQVNNNLVPDTNDVVLRALFNGASSTMWKDATAAASTYSIGTHQSTRIMIGNRSTGSTTYLNGKFYGGFMSIGNVPSDPDKAEILTWCAALQGRSL